jgi:oligopeptidase B
VTGDPAALGAVPPGAVPPAAPVSGGPDPYAWMRDRDLPAMRDYLAAERASYDRWLESVRGLRDELGAELAARVLPAEESVSWRRAGHSYFPRTVPGREYEQFCRAAGRGRPAQVLLDENLLAQDPACGGYLGLGVREISPDGRLLAYSVDFDGDELYQLRVRDLARGTDLPERIEGTYYGLAWSADSRSLLYVITDAHYRPHEVWRHALGTGPGTGPGQDVLVFREEDQRFELTVRATRSGTYVLIETASRDSSETLVLPAAGIGEQPTVLEKRRPGTE